MNHSILFASSNPGKTIEVTEAAQRYSSIRVIGLDEFRSKDAGAVAGPLDAQAVPEVGQDYYSNACLKARAYSRAFHTAVIADDAGVEVDALGGLPGVYTARFGVQRVLAELLPGKRYSAKFVCCLAFAEPTGRIVATHGRLSGVMVVPLKGAQGMPAHPNVSSPLPFSQLFIPDGQRETLAELGKQGFRSHRVMALDALFRALWE